jgi:Family of unknown function (DUF5677)
MPVSALPPKYASSREVVEEVLKLVEGMSSANLGSRREDIFVPVHALTMHTLEACRAALTLIDTNQPAMVDVVSRVALEHAVTVQWLCMQPERLPEYMSHMAWMQQGFIKALDKDDFDLPEDMRTNWLGDQPDMRKSKVLNFAAEVFKESNASTLYVRVWKHLCSAVHPSETTVTRYVNIDTNPTQYNQRQHRDDYEALYWVLALSAVLSTTAYTDLIEGEPYKSALATLAVSGPITIPCWLTENGEAPANRRYSRLGDLHQQGT